MGETLGDVEKKGHGGFGVSGEVLSWLRDVRIAVIAKAFGEVKKMPKTPCNSEFSA